MRHSREYPSVTVSDKCCRYLEGGHVWVYDAEIVSVDGAPYKSGDSTGFENGSVVDIVSLKNKYLGTGLWSEHSKIRVRIISVNSNDQINEDFWRRRVRYAIDYRKTVMGDDFAACRLIFGEADHFPGLTVDLFGDVIVFESLSYGIDIRKNVILPLIVDELKKDGISIRGCYERSESDLRNKEGLLPLSGWFDNIPHSGPTETLIKENGVKYIVDFENGQKTGFFLDQKYNRHAAAKLARGKRVLDCFTHTGSFALNCALNGAEKVTAADISSTAIEAAKKNASLNGLEGKIDFCQTDVFDYLDALSDERKQLFDMIILDPPAFTKSRNTVRGAERGYREINFKAMKLLPRGGYLATCSCSHFMTTDLFRDMLTKAASDAGVELRQIESRQQSPDHPILLNVPETDYLKFFIFQVV